MPRTVLLLVFVVFGVLVAGCGDDVVGTSSPAGSLPESIEFGEEEDPHPAGDDVRPSTGSGSSHGVPEFYEQYRVAVDPLFQQAPDLIGTGYAFSWLDHERELVVVSATEAVPEETQAALAELIPAELSIEYRIVDNSAAELAATQQVLLQNADAIGPVTSFGTFSVENKVVIDTADVEETTARLRDLGVDLLTVVVQLGSATPASQAQPGGIDGPVLYSGSSDGFGMDAILGGSVIFEGPCIYLTPTPDSLENRSLVMWPLGTRWQHDPPAVVLPGGEEVGPGDSVKGGGGYLKLDTVEQVAGLEGQDVVDACSASTDGNVAFFNLESTVEVIDD